MRKKDILDRRELSTRGKKYKNDHKNDTKMIEKKRLTVNIGPVQLYGYQTSQRRLHSFREPSGLISASP